MRILFCSQAAHTGGGVEAWLESLSEGLAAGGWEVVTALAKGRFHDPVRYAARHRVLNPIEIDGTRGLLEARILELVRIFERVRPDVIVPVNLADVWTAAALWKTRGHDARLAVCIHGQSADRIDQVRRLAPFIDLGVSVSRRVANQLAEVLQDSSRVRHIPTGVPAPVRAVQPRERIRDIAYVGRLDRGDKRVGDAVAMIRELDASDVVFHFAGTGPDEEWLRNQLSEKRAVFHGALDRAALYETIYPSIDGVVIFSEAETGPIVAWEAMAHGVIPIVSDYVGRSEENVIRNGETGIVFPVGQPEIAARALRALPPDRVHELSERARRELPAAYTVESFHRQWLDALETCVRTPLRAGETSDLPPLVSPGMLGRLGLGPAMTARVRKLFGREFVHRDPGSEWPH